MKNHTKAYLSYIFICIVWGTTYLGIRVAVLHYPPFLMAGVRQFSSGIILAIAAFLLNRKADWSRQHVLRQVFAGFLLITVGNGLVTWAEQYVSSGVAALICSTMPISAVVINILKGKEKLNLLILAGMLLGFGGVALIFCDNLQQSGNGNMFVIGIIALFIATFGWAFGSILNKRTKPAMNVLMDSAIQVAAGGLIMLLISPAADDYTGLVLFNKDGLIALAYLIVFGSVLAYAAYMYALKELPVGLVTSYAYVNPLVAVVLGSLFLGEPLNGYTIFAFLLIISGIVIVRRGYKKQEQLRAVSE